MPTLRELQAVIEDLWPAAGAESWDAVGLVAGDPDQTIEHVHLAVDAVPATAHVGTTASTPVVLPEAVQPTTVAETAAVEPSDAHRTDEADETEQAGWWARLVARILHAFGRR